MNKKRKKKKPRLMGQLSEGDGLMIRPKNKNPSKTTNNKKDPDAKIEHD